MISVMSLSQVLLVDKQAVSKKVVMGNRVLQVQGVVHQHQKDNN